MIVDKIFHKEVNIDRGRDRQHQDDCFPGRHGEG
jgi:hypothetical protein